ncbi:hypothetical protein HDU97_005376 [Phlyctochytrium planicorne]|nr:hypothetical protein HDU97_005376 [Phlyctochytrium planicorne]
MPFLEFQKQTTMELEMLEMDAAKEIVCDITKDLPFSNIAVNAWKGLRLAVNFIKGLTTKEDGQITPGSQPTSVNPSKTLPEVNYEDQSTFNNAAVQTDSEVISGSVADKPSNTFQFSASATSHSTSNTRSLEDKRAVLGPVARPRGRKLKSKFSSEYERLIQT